MLRSGSAGKIRLAASLVAPDLDVEAVREAIASGKAFVGEPVTVFGKCLCSSSFRHKQDALAGDLKAFRHGDDLGEVFWQDDHEFEEGLFALRKKLESLITNTQFGRIARVREFRGDIELLNHFDKFGGGELGAIGLDFDC